MENTTDHPGHSAKAGHGDSARGRVLDLWSFTGRYRILHLTWFAFFLSFVVWFSFAPFAYTIADQLGLTSEQMVTIGLANVALTVPARVLLGMALDRWGPRRVFSAVLIYSAVPTVLFAFATSFEAMVLARVALSVVGAGFVVGIRMVSEWFPAREVGTAEGIYGGWGNFGSAAAAFSLPVVAGVLGGDGGWRWAIASTGVIAAAYGCFYFRAVEDTPEGITYVRPRRQGALEVTSPAAVLGLVALTVPLTGVLALIAWRVKAVNLLSDTAMAVILLAVIALTVFQVLQVIRVNRPALSDEYPQDDQYPMRSVAVLCGAYFCTFGSELAVVTMLPAFFADLWGLGPAMAGVAASGFAFMNLVSRPVGGLLSDLFGSRRRTLRALMVGLVGGYLMMSTIGPQWPWGLAVVATMMCSFFVQSGEGAVFAIVPLVKKRVSGQISGMVGAYGIIGGVVFITISSLVDPSAFFVILAAAAIVGVTLNRFLVEPSAGATAEVSVGEPQDCPERRHRPLVGVS